MKTMISILSDLGTRDYFVGAMKGVILSINPNAQIVDITHEIPKQDIRTGAFVLAHSAETFPKGTIFICVVDPGVGTERKCILLETRNGMFFIGPDNGLFTLVAERFGIAKIYELTNRALMRPEISPTFHGRDIMAPVAAHLSLGLEPARVGPELKAMKRLKIPRPRLTKNEIRCRVLKIDDFGNLVTNVGGELISRFAKLGETLKVKVGKKAFTAKFVKTFGDVGAGERLAYVGSAGMLELAENMGNLAEKLRSELPPASPGGFLIQRRDLPSNHGLRRDAE